MNLCLRSITFSRIILNSSPQQTTIARNVSLVSRIRTGIEAVSPSTLLGVNCVEKTQRRGAGSSKWHNIKDTKTSKDAARGVIFSRVAWSIKMALKDGSANPAANTKLAVALEVAKSVNMPKTTIKGIIEKSQKTMENAKEYYLEYRGLDGLCLYVQLYTDNLKRGRTLINTVLKKSSFRESKSTGSVRHLFEERGTIVSTSTAKGIPVTFEQAEEHAIEVEAEEVNVHNESIQFLCNPKEVHLVRSGLLNYGYEILSSEIEFIPIKPVELSDEALESLATVVEKLEEIEDINKIYANA